MCLGIPGRLLETFEHDGLPMGRIEFGGIVKQTCLAYTPEAKTGDYVIVHAGFAISIVDEAEAAEIFSFLREIGETVQAEETAGGDCEKMGTVPVEGS
jgi:hydrogenase expression/formation protein HypC